MNNLITIIATLSEEEKKEFLQNLRRKTRRGDIKNVALFKLLDQGKTGDIDIKLYGKPSRNAYHALCKRLQDNLIDFIAQKSFAGETSEEMEIMKQLLASRIFFEHKQFRIAFKYLEKAERLALALDLYSILTEIYHTKIQYAHLHPSESLDSIIAASKSNMEYYQREIRLNMAYATIKDRFNKGEREAVEIIKESFSLFDIDIDANLTYKSLFQLLKLLSEAAQLKSDYYTVLPLATNIYTIVNAKKTVAHKHLYYHIEILNLMALVSFRNKDFKSSFSFAEQMETQMHTNDGAYYNRFIEGLTLLKSLNLNFTGNPLLAIELLKAFPKKSYKIDLALAMCLFQQQQFSEAYQIMKNLNHSDGYFEKKEGLIWVLQKNIIELLLLIELEKLELVWSRLKSFNRKYFPRLKELKEDRVINFVKLVGLYFEDPKVATTNSFKEKVEESFEWKAAVQEDIFVMSFYAWLKSKMEKTPLYHTTLELVNRD